MKIFQAKQKHQQLDDVITYSWTYRMEVVDSCGN